jgi:hypothetical protein
MKYLGINLTRDVKDLYKEKYKPLKEEVYKDYRRWKDLSGSWIDWINIVRMTILLKAIYMFSAIPAKTPMVFITETERL